MSRLLFAYLRLYRDSIAGLPRETWILAAVTLVHRAGTMVVPFLALWFAEALGIGAAETGTLLALFGGGVAAGSYLGGHLSDRFGALRVQAGSLALTGVGFWLLPLCTSAAALATALPVLGVVSAVFRPASGAAFAATCPGELRAQAFAFFRLAINLGMGIGPALGGLLAAHDFGLLFAVDGSVCILSAGLLLAWTRGWDLAGPTGSGAAEAHGGGSPWRDRLFLCIAANTFVLALVGFQWLGTGPVFLAESYGLDKPSIGLLLALNPVIIVLSETILVRGVRGRPPLPFIALSGVLLAISCALLPLGSGFAWGVLVVAFWTAAEMLETPLSSAFAATRASSRFVGRYMGVYTLAFSLSQMLAPLIGFRVYAGLGSDALWLGAAAVALASAAGVAALSRRA